MSGFVTWLLIIGGGLLALVLIGVGALALVVRAGGGLTAAATDLPDEDGEGMRTDDRPMIDRQRDFPTDEGNVTLSAGGHGGPHAKPPASAPPPPPPAAAAPPPETTQLDLGPKSVPTREDQERAVREAMARALAAQQQQLQQQQQQQQAHREGSGSEDRAHKAWLEAIREAAPPAAALPALDPREYRVWFGTNRKPIDAGDPAKGFSGERDEEAVHYGHCDVLVPEAHKTGSTGSSWWRRLVSGVDDRLKINRLRVLAAEDYWPGVAAQLAAAAPGKRHALIFIHGYKNSFEDAAIRAAQIGFDLGIEGAMAFFSWASRGALQRYSADEATIGWSAFAIADFIADFAAKSGAEQVHVIAHSMGNRGLLDAVERIVADADRRQQCRLGQIILAAADVDAGQFRKQAGVYKALAAGTTLYVSEKDRAVELSEWKHDFDRVGFAPPVAIFPEIETVSVTGVDMTQLGHGYVAEARPVLEDISELIHFGTPAAGRTPRRLAEKTDQAGRRYWAVKA